MVKDKIRGIPKDKNMHIGILGAGIGGLHTALMFENLNKTKGYKITYELIERTDRVGGRILTKYYKSEDPTNYSDMGAMRLPANNTPIFDLIDYVNQCIDEKNSETPKGCLNRPYP
jgi:monoamine oxidase